MQLAREVELHLVNRSPYRLRGFAKLDAGRLDGRTHVTMYVETDETQEALHVYDAPAQPEEEKK